ncbi:MAG: glycosyltransferase family 4 protein [Muribaculaceae bacterium]|nr:glycosyltransferase family 4 protein [Muribaculaceae bacterium]
MKTNNILYIITEYNGGMRPYALSLLKVLYKKGDKIAVVIRNNNLRNEFNWIDKPDIKFIEYPDNKISRIGFRIYPKSLIDTINSIISHSDIDIAYTLTGELILCNFLKKLQTKIPVLHTIHDAIPHDTKILSIKQWLNNHFFLTLPNLKINKIAKNTITNSKSQLDYLRHKYPNNNHYYCPFPSLITDAIVNGNTNVKELINTDPYLLFFGRIEQYKGIHLLYDLYINYPDLHKYPLVIAGSGKIYFDKDDNNKNIKFLNRYFEDEELKSLFMKAEVVVFPYISGTQSGVLSLASFFGKKIVVSNIPFFKETAYNNTGITITDVNSLEVFHKDILETLNDCSSTYDYYKTNYSKDNQSILINDIIKKIL